MDDGTTADEVIELDAAETRWSPAPDLLRHSGDPIDPRSDFFAEPPAEIGELVSAETSLREGQKPWRLPTRLAMIGLIGWGGYMVTDYLARGAGPWDQGTYMSLGLLATFVVMVVAWFLTRFSQTCSYVGKLGIARFRCVGSRSRARLKSLFLFEDAADLRTSQTRHYTNGIYTGTAYAFNWTNDAGKKVFKLTGNYRGENKPPRPKTPTTWP